MIASMIFIVGSGKVPFGVDDIINSYSIGASYFKKKPNLVSSKCLFFLVPFGLPCFPVGFPFVVILTPFCSNGFVAMIA